MNLSSIFTKYPTQESCLPILQEQQRGAQERTGQGGPLELPRLQVQLQRPVRRPHAQDPGSPTKVVPGDQPDRQRQEKPVRCQLARDLDLNQKTAWYMRTRIRVAMVNRERRHHRSRRNLLGRQAAQRQPTRRRQARPKGRGTAKRLIVGAVERGGRVVAKTAASMSGKIL